MWHIVACDKLSHVILRHSRGSGGEDFIVSTEYISSICAALRNQPLLLIVLNIAVRYPLIYHVRNA